MSRHIPCPKCGHPITINTHSRAEHLAVCDGIPRTTNQRKQYLRKLRQSAIKK